MASCHYRDDLLVGSRRGFTLVEMLVAVTVFLMILVVVFQVTKATTSIWKNSSGKIAAFAEARGAFEAMTRTISQATLNTYVDYEDSSGAFRDPGAIGTFVPTKYARRSDLQFLCGKGLLSGSGLANPITQSLFFQAPMGYSRSAGYKGMQGMLNACGFFVYYGTDMAKPSFLPGSLPNRNRFRLMQFLQPTENLSIYDSSVTGGSTVWNNKDWFIKALAADVASTSPTSVSQIADNVVALIIAPKNSASDDAASPANAIATYDYNTRDPDPAKAYSLNQLPAVIQVVMAVIDDASAAKLGDSATPPNLTAGTNFSNPTDLKTNLAILEKNLSALPGNAAGNTIPLRFEFFTTEVAIPAAKWSAN
ncbi:hypothetical protein BH09VER1_BH09VER1_19340 [soil metagenome]